MAIIHIVLFEFKPTLEPALIDDTCTRMLSLRQKCIHPTTGQPYIVSSSGGKDMSIEGHQGGITHGFVVEFANKEDRDYYVEKDPAHLEFVKGLGDVVEKVVVVDYEKGVF